MSSRYEDYEQGGWNGRQRTISHKGRVPPLRHLAEDRIHDQQRHEARLASERRGGYGLAKPPIDTNKLFPHLQKIMNAVDEVESRELMWRCQE